MKTLPYFRSAILFLLLVQTISPAFAQLTAVTQTATASGRIATADELFLQQGSFILRTARDYRYLTVKDWEPHEQSIVFLWSYTDHATQQVWKFIPKEGGYYKIKSESGLFLSQKRILVPTTEPESNEDSQLWQLSETGDGYYTIRSKTNKYLVLADRRNRDGGLAGFAVNATNAPEQKWHLIKWTNDGRRMTSFIPETHGFHFVNNFNGEDFIRWAGLCGGMVYTALDYYRAGIPIPRQSYMPANATPLQSYIYNRQNHSMWNVNEKWSELEVGYNTRGSEFFRWGLQGTGGGRLEELRNTINAGVPLPLGLFAGGVRGKDNSDGSRHVVVAAGYAMGRYQGNLTGHMEDYKMFIYNPNNGNKLCTLVPDLMHQCYFQVESGRAWRCYFVNTKYNNDHVPPRDVPNYPEGEPEGSVRHLYVEFATGKDDLRGNNDNVSITINYSDGTQQVFGNVNNGARWVDESYQTVHLALNRPVRRSDIRNFMITTSFGSDFMSDDWNLERFIVTSGAGGITYAFSEPAAGAEYIFRFSGDQGLQRYIVRTVTE
jgi:hypothetical protein